MGNMRKKGSTVQPRACLCRRLNIAAGNGHALTLLASERSERDTIRGVQIRAGAVRIYIY